ncbi:hypothetical protein EDEG_00648 [Edhazardia aedis USNM 41457]|uniref:Deoxyhypusine hydroxylase n=1 Tax=Edhazardia aedis (strain USNM 41457) TaxID=1003232 RepID=J9DRU5_EDHAE|nr:hypothetical protein EDEG_00648 [Edhazardia aedis USNM 41457]|eukprot:EJW05290.1 hypothetical protein EDEG_00648 [Edhazardia aedis USNM 41457]
MTTDIQIAQGILLNTALPIKHRMRAMFYLRNVPSFESIKAISTIFKDKSVLLKHEGAYVLGQMLVKESLKILLDVLKDEEQDEIARHEAGEALGNFVELFSEENISSSQNENKKSAKDENRITYNEILETLKKYSEHKIAPIRETCYIALKKHEEYQKIKSEDNSFKPILSPFLSHDPAYPYIKKDFDSVSKIYLDAEECLYKRYKAMFYLRNLNTKESIEKIGEAINDKSALFKHEIAFVFGQMRNKLSIPYLKCLLEDENEHGMVRHEAAEALGAIGSEESLDIVLKFINDSVDVVRESVEVAIDIHDYETGLDEEYAIL